jgi:hypothetical protein
MPTEYFLAFSGDVVSRGHACQLGTIFMRDHLYDILTQEGNVWVDICVYNGATAVMISTLWDSETKIKPLLVQGKFEVELRTNVG